MSKVVDNLIKYGHVYTAVALNHSSLQAQEAQNNQVYAGLIENVTGAPVNMHHSWPFPFRSIQSTTIDGFKRPRAITIIPGGNILVLERDGKCVSRIIANERVQLPHGNVCQLQWSTGIAAYQQEQGGPVYIFVVDRRNNRFQLSINQNNLTYCGTPRADVHPGVQKGIGSMFKSPVGIAVHPVTGRVYVADTGNHRIWILDENLRILAKEELVTNSSSDHMTYSLLMMAIMLLCMLLIMTTTESRSLQPMTLYTLGQVGEHMYKQQEQAGSFLKCRVIEF